MLTVGIWRPAVACRIHNVIQCIWLSSRMGIIYTMRGLSALSVSTVLGNARALARGMGNRQDFPRFFCIVKKQNITFCVDDMGNSRQTIRYEEEYSFIRFAHIFAVDRF